MMVGLLFSSYSSVVSQKVTSTFCADSTCTSAWTPYDNMVAGLRGYDPVDTDLFSHHEDPGIKSQMFLPTMAAQDGTTRFDMQPFILVHTVETCKATVTTKTFSSFNDYSNYKLKSRSFDDTIEKSSERNLWFWKSSKSSLKRYSRQGETEDLIKFFKETNGEIYVTEAECETYIMEINPYVPLAFTDGFTSALRSLEFAASQPKNSKVSDKIFFSFVENYGTHFISEVTMGAKLWIETRYSSKSNSRESIAKRMECIQKSLQEGSSKGFETPEVTYDLGVEKGPVKASANFKMQQIKLGSSSNSNSQRNRCSNDEKNSEYFRNNALEETVIRTVGSRPSSNLENWVTSDFVPAPISYKIKPMTEIFKPIFEPWNPDGNLGAIFAKAADDDDDDDKLDSTKINDFFMSKVKQYCNLILGMECPSFKHKHHTHPPYFATSKPDPLPLDIAR